MLEDFVSAFLGLIVLSKEKAEEFIDLLVEKGEICLLYTSRCV